MERGVGVTHIWHGKSTAAAEGPSLLTPPLFVLFHPASPSKPSTTASPKSPSPKSPGDSSHFRNLSAPSLQ